MRLVKLIPLMVDAKIVIYQDDKKSYEGKADEIPIWFADEKVEMIVAKEKDLFNIYVEE